MALCKSQHQLRPARKQHTINMYPSNGCNTPAHIPRSRPQCTHRSMTRLHGPNTCDVCGQIPSFGWLYLCIQDTIGVPSLHLDSQSAADGFSSVTEEIQELIALGISASIIDQYQAGGYTSAQIERIKEQKRLVYELVSEATYYNAAAPSTPRRSLFDAGNPFLQHINDTALTPRRALKEPPPSGSLHRELTPPYLTGCQYKCCHRCRPYLYDRLPASIDGVVKGEEPPLSPSEMKSLPILDCEILKGLSGRSQSLHTSYPVSEPRTPHLGAHPGHLVNLPKDTPFDYSDKNGAYTPSTGEPTSPASTEASASNISSASLPATPLSTRAVTRDYRVDSPAMRKVASWHHLKSSMLPSLDARMFNDRFNTSTSRTSSIDSYFSTADSSSLYSEELEVQGGVALTEEAVEMGLPDIVTGDMTRNSADV